MKVNIIRILSGRNIASVALGCGVFLLLSAALLFGEEPPQFSSWSAPVNLGTTVNSGSYDWFPFVSKNGLSLYFTSATCTVPTPGCHLGYGGHDIFVSQRASVNDPWGAAQNLGPTINTADDEGSPTLSADGHLMYFASTRPGGFGGADIYVSRRHNKRDDLGWQAPQNLGSGVNTISNENGPEIFEDEETGVTTLYFDSNRAGGPGPLGDDGTHNGNDIYMSILQNDDTFGAATLVAELNTPSIERQTTIRRDGLEIFFGSNRPGGYGFFDLWVSTRATTSDPWSPPVNLGPVVNTAFTDGGPAISADGTVLYISSNRLGGFGSFDLYVSTRTKLHGPE